MNSRSPDPVDDLLVMQAQDGDRWSLEELVRRWQRRLWVHAYRLTGRTDAAWDVYYLEGLTVPELGVVLGVPVGTVKSRLHAAREEFKRLWAKSREADHER